MPPKRSQSKSIRKPESKIKLEDKVYQNLRKIINNVDAKTSSLETLEGIYEIITKIYSRDCNEFGTEILDREDYATFNKLEEIFRRRFDLLLELAKQKTKMWKACVNDLISQLHEYYNQNVPYDIAEVVFIRTLDTYKSDWNGLRTIITTSKGKLVDIKNISVYDTADREKCLYQLKNIN